MSSSRWNRTDTDRYDDQWARLEAAGKDPHGEVAFIQRFDPTCVLDGGCGTGRVAIELANRGVAAIGVDLDQAMLDAARAKAPDMRWEQADMAAIDLRDEQGDRLAFDVIALPGNVMIFVAPGTEGAVLVRCREHLADGGRLIAGFQLGRGLALDEYDRLATEAGLELESRYATWDGDPWLSGGDYAVSVHRTRGHFSPVGV